MNKQFTKHLLILSIFMGLSSLGLAQQKEEGNKKNIQFGKYSFELFKKTPDTVWIEDIDGGAPIKKITQEDWQAVKMNGQKVWDATELGMNAATPPESLDVLLMKLINQHQDIFLQLPDGRYHLPLNQLVVDTNGLLVYWQCDGLHKIQENGNISQELLLKERLSDIVNAFFYAQNIYFTPAIVEGKKVISGPYNGNVRFTINQGKLSFDI